jgi:hypothetical protein
MKLKLDSKMATGPEDVLGQLAHQLYERPGARIVGVVELAHVERTQPAPDTDAESSVKMRITALEVGLYEGTYGQHAGALGHSLEPFFIPLLLLLSAIKFALVAMYYMHLKNDSKLFSGVFVFPLVIAAVVILALIALQAYHWSFARSGG